MLRCNVGSYHLLLIDVTEVCISIVLIQLKHVFCFVLQLVNGGEDVLVFYNDRASFPVLLNMMGSERERSDENGALAYHITLVELLAACTEGKNVDTELKCNSLLPLDDIIKVVIHEDCIPEVIGHYNPAVLNTSRKGTVRPKIMLYFNMLYKFL